MGQFDVRQCECDAPTGVLHGQIEGDGAICPANPEVILVYEESMSDYEYAIGLEEAVHDHLVDAPALLCRNKRLSQFNVCS